MATVFVSGAQSDVAPDALKELASRHTVVTDPGGIASPAFAACADRVEGIVALLTDRIDDALLARCPGLRVVANVAVGFDNVDRDACKKKNVVATNTPDVLTEATADLAFGLLIAAKRRIAEGDRLVRAGEWTGWTPTFMLGEPVFGSTLGIVGFGRIGQAMARRARGFGMHVLYHQRRRIPEGLERALGATFVPSLDELCSWSDTVSIHLPLTDETRGLFDARRFEKMRLASVLVNTSRGAIVDEDALAQALEAGPLAAAGIDVFENEPHVHPGLVASTDAVLTPHIGSAERRTREAMVATAVTNVLRVLAGEPPLTPI